MKTLSILFIVSLTFFTMSCAQLSLDYDYDYDRGTDFARLRTFNLLPVRVQASELVIKNIKEAVNKELEAKGFMLNQASPDFLIAIHGKKVTKGEAAGFESIDSYSWRGPYGRHSRPRELSIARYEAFEWEEGTYTLAILDANSKKLIWRGTVQGEVVDASIKCGKAETANL